MSDENHIEYVNGLRKDMSTHADIKIQELCITIAEIDDNLFDLQEGNSKDKEEMIKELSAMKESMIREITILRAGGRK